MTALFIKLFFKLFLLTFAYSGYAQNPNQGTPAAASFNTIKEYHFYIIDTTKTPITSTPVGIIKKGSAWEWHFGVDTYYDSLFAAGSAGEPTTLPWINPSTKRMQYSVWDSVKIYPNNLAQPVTAVKGGTGLSSSGTSGQLVTSNGTGFVMSTPSWLLISDTAVMLTSYLRKQDTVSMLSKYLRIQDTTNKWMPKGMTFGTGTVTSIGTTSPLSGGTITTSGTISIANSKADNTTKGAGAFDSLYHKDNGSGIISFSPTSGIGTVAANAVTINEPKGKITLTTPSILANANLSITFTNSLITTNSIINVGINGGGSALSVGLNCYVKSQTNGSCVINLLNLSLLTTFSTGVVIDYFIVN